jgi:hypothetical protein
LYLCVYRAGIGECLCLGAKQKCLPNRRASVLATGARLGSLGISESGGIPVIKYRVVVGGKGVVYEGEDQLEANRICASVVARIKGDAETSDRPTVALFKDYQIIRQWHCRPDS